ncbi:MAG: MFS transporter [Bacteroidota bacterium]
MKPKLAYHWIIAAACMLIAIIGLGLANGTLSLYVKPICDDLGFSRGAYSLVYTIAYIFQMTACFTFGAVQKRLGGVKKIFLSGIISLCAAFVIYNRAQSISMFYIGAAFFGIGIGYTAAVPLSVMVANWFVEKRGTVFSMVYSGSGIGGIILNPLVGNWITLNGWRASYLFSIFLMLAFLIPAYILLREKPSVMSLTPFGAHSQTSINVDPDAKPSGTTLEQVRKTRTFWQIAGAILLFGISIQPVYVNAAAHLGEAGLNPQVVAYIMGGVFLSNTLSKIILGMINDKYGTKLVLVINNLSFCIGTLFLIFTSDASFGFAFAVFFGVSYTMTSITIPMLTSMLYAGEDYGKILGILVAFQTAGYALGTPLSGLFFDMFHSYSNSFGLAILLDIIAATLVLTTLSNYRQVVKPPSPKYDSI